MSHPLAERLSAYIDGELDAAERAALERHLTGCADCQGAVTELGGVRQRLGSDGIRPGDAPSKAEWRAIEQRIHRRRRLRGVAIGAGLLAAAALAVLMIGRPTSSLDGPSAVYSQATGDLEALLRDNRARLRPETVRALERSLTVIDSALTQAEQALAADPANDYVIRSIDQLRGRRLATLRDAVVLAQE
jgi:anti-sigma factor RsiW